MKRDRDTAGIDEGLKEEELGPIRPPNPGFRYAYTTFFYLPPSSPHAEPMEEDSCEEEPMEEPMDVDEGYVSNMDVDGEEDTLSSSFRRLSVCEQ
jgi:hypothetical protein